MKRIILLLPLFVLLISSARSQNITIAKGKVSINKVTVTPGWTIADFVKGFGPKAGYVEGFTNVHHLENAGVLLYEKGTSDTVSEVQVYMTANELTPETGVGLFKGVLKIEGNIISAVNTPAAVTGLLTGWQSVETYGEHYFKFTNGNMYLFIRFTDDELKIDEISFGQH